MENLTGIHGGSSTNLEFLVQNVCGVKLHYLYLLWLNTCNVPSAGHFMSIVNAYVNTYRHHHLSHTREGRWGTTDDFATSFLKFSQFSTAFWDLPNSRPVHSLMLSSHLFLCLLCLILSFAVPCKMVLDRPDERET